MSRFAGTLIFISFCGAFVSCGSTPTAQVVRGSSVSGLRLYAAAGVAEGGVVTWDSFMEPVVTIHRSGEPIRLGVTPGATAMGVSPDGLIVAVASVDNASVSQVQLYDGLTGEKLHRIDGPPGAIQAVAVANGGASIALAVSSPSDSSHNAVKLRTRSGVEMQVDLSAVAGSDGRVFVDRLFFSDTNLVLSIAGPDDCVVAAVPPSGAWIARCVVRSEDLAMRARSEAVVVGVCEGALVILAPAGGNGGSRARLTGFAVSAATANPTDVGSVDGEGGVLSCDGRLVSLDSSSPDGFAIANVDLSSVSHT